MAARTQPPARTQELIFLDSDDDLGTIRAKLESSAADEVFLVVPRGASTLRTPLEYRILARIAHELSTDVTIVSSDAGRRQLAKQEGLRARRGYASVRNLVGPAGASPRWRPAIPEWLPLPSLTAGVVLGALLLLVGGFTFLALPVMRVTVTPSSENVQRELEIFVDSNQKIPDPATAVLPGETFPYRFEVAGSVPTTGQKNVGRDPARGEVTFSNTTGNAIVLPARSVVVARNGARFLTDAEVRLNAYSYGIARAGITAEQRGIAGNIESNQLASLDPPLPGVTAANTRPTVGGSDRQAKSVAAADAVRLKEQLLQRAREQSIAEFAARGGSAKSVPANTLQIRTETENYQPAVEAEGDQLTGTMAVSATAVGWDNQGLNNLVQKMVLSKFGPEYELPMSQLQLAPPEMLDIQNQRLRLKIKADALVVRALNADQIADQLGGKSAGEARSILQRLPGLDGSPRIDITPSWAPRAYRVEIAVADPK